jgi:hypothetical protein
VAAAVLSTFAGDTPAATTLGSIRASRVGCGALAATLFLIRISEKVRDREGAITSTRGGRGPQSDTGG